MMKPAALPRSIPSWLSRGTVALAVSRRDGATRRGRPAEEVRREVQATILGVHIALPQTMIDEAVAYVLAWREFRLATPPGEFMATGTPRSAVAGILASRGVAVGVLVGESMPAARALAVAAE